MRDTAPHAARCLHGRLAEAMAAVIGSDLLKSRFNPTVVLTAASPIVTMPIRWV